MSVLIVLFAAIAPFPLLFVESILPYPHVVEEITKLILIFMIPTTLSLQKKLALGAGIGLAFAFTESVLYSLNIYPTLDTGSLLLRFLPILMHILTSIIMTVSIWWNKKLAIISLVIAVFMHYIFNQVLSH